MLGGKVRALSIALYWSFAGPALGAPHASAVREPNAGTVPGRTRATEGRPGVAAAVAELADWVKGRGGSASIRVVDTDTGGVWAESAPDLAENPASNMKLITAAVALDRLGPDFSFSTGLYGDVIGDRVETLVLRGEGDPALATLDLAELAQTIAHLGIAGVGQILVDQSRFDDQFVPPAFAQQPEEWAAFRAPVSAVALDRNSITLFVAPSAAGRAARIWFEPPGVVAVEGTIETRSAGAGEGVQLALEMRGAELTARLGGYVAQGLPRLRFDRRLDDPRRAPGLVLRQLLVEAHVQVQGSVGLGGADVKTRLAFHESNTLAMLLPMLGKHSDNFTAETLFKVLGARATGQPASSADGAKVVRDWLAAHALSSAETRIENGSGLFDADRVSARTLSGVLEVARRDPAIFPEYLAQLSIGGVDGTLHGRFRKFRAQRSIRAKTGTLAATTALSGYVLPPNAGAPIAFSILVNGIEGQTAAVRDRVDHVVEALADSVSRPLAGSPGRTDIKAQSLGQTEGSHPAQRPE